MRSRFVRRAALLVAPVALVLTAGACGGSSTASSTPGSKLPVATDGVAPDGVATTSSSVPGFLPKPAVVDRVLDATVAHPALGIEGDRISLTVPGGHVEAQLVGPQVPSAGVAPFPNYTDVLFQLTLSAASGHVPLTAMDFTVTDELGRVSRPEIIPRQGPITTIGPVPTGRSSAARGAAPGAVPTSVPTSGSVNVDLVDPQIAVGNGNLAWGPGTSGHQVASWDFTVEVD